MVEKKKNSLGHGRWESVNLMDLLISPDLPLSLGQVWSVGSLPELNTSC
jgi:hypothetical protein